MLNIDIERIRKLANGATKDSWIHFGVRTKLGNVDCMWVGPDTPNGRIIAIPYKTDHAGAFRDAAYVAAANPIQILSILDDLEKSQNRVKKLETLLTNLETALLKDSRNKTILSDTVEYHLDGQFMYQVINQIRDALKEK